MHDNTDRGALFVNDRKKTEKHPDFTGTLDVQGIEYWVSGWKNVSRNNHGKYISLALTKKEQSSPDTRNASTPPENPTPSDPW